MARRNPVLLSAFALSAAGAFGCASNHTPAPGGSGSAAPGSAGTPASITVVPAASCSDAPAPMIAPDAADPLCTPGLPQVSFQRDVAPLVRCTGEACHVPWSYSTLVAQPSTACCDRRFIVDPGHPTTSQLIQAVSDDDSCVGRMGQLEAPEIATLVAWICEGAPND